MDTHQVIQSLCGVRRALIGTIHLQALPGTPGNALQLDAITAMAVDDARTYREAGFDALLIENTHDHGRT